MPHRTQVQAACLAAGVLTQVTDISCALVMEEGKAKVAASAGLIPAYRAGNSMAKIHVLYLEEITGDAHSKPRHPGPSMAMLAVRGLQVAKT